MHLIICSCKQSLVGLLSGTYSTCDCEHVRWPTCRAMWWSTCGMQCSASRTCRRGAPKTLACHWRFATREAETLAAWRSSQHGVCAAFLCVVVELLQNREPINGYFSFRLVLKPTPRRHPETQPDLWPRFAEGLPSPLKFSPYMQAHLA